MILTTGHSIEGYEIIEYLDIVAAEFAHQTTYFKGFISKEIYNVSNAAGVLDKTQGGIISGQCRTFILRGLKNQAEKLGADGIISVSLQFSSITDDFVMLFATGTAVKIRKKHDDNKIDYHKLSALINAEYLDRVVKDNAKVAREIEDRKQKIAIHKEILVRKEKAWSDKKSKINEKIYPIDERIEEIEDKITKTRKTIEKFTSNEKNNLNDTIAKKNKELLEKMIVLWGKLVAEKESIQAEVISFEKEYAHEYDEHQRLIRELREYENSL